MKTLKNLIFLLLCGISFAAFSQDSMPPVNPPVTRHQVLLNKNIRLEDNGMGGVYPQIDSGNNIMFEYHYQRAEHKGIADDEYTESIVFQVDKKHSKHFVLTDESLKNAHAFFYRGCFCLYRGYHRIELGTITGKRINKRKWKISIDIKVKLAPDQEDSTSYKIKGFFYIKNK